MARAEAYLRAKFRLDPSNSLATVHERYRQTGQDRQRTDSIGRTVLQTVAQKWLHEMEIPQEKRNSLFITKNEVSGIRQINK